MRRWRADVFRAANSRNWPHFAPEKNGPGEVSDVIALRRTEFVPTDLTSGDSLGTKNLNEINVSPLSPLVPTCPHCFYVTRDARASKTWCFWWPFRCETACFQRVIGLNVAALVGRPARSRPCDGRQLSDQAGALASGARGRECSSWAAAGLRAVGLLLLHVQWHGAGGCAVASVGACGLHPGQP